MHSNSDADVLILEETFGCAIAIVIISAVLKNYANWMALGEKIWLLSPWDLNK
jgi:hypothetical protein